MKINCSGCQADLEKAVGIPLKMNRGVLVVVCPLCRFQNIAKTDDHGNVIVLKMKE